MNGIKKALSNRRSSTTSSGSDEVARANSSANTTPETSPRQAPGKKLMDEPVATRKNPVVTDGTGLGRSQAVVDGEGANAHSTGHNANVNPSELTGEVTQDVQHLQHATEETRHRHHIEEVTRQKDLHKHHYHVQHHRQEVLDTEHLPEQQHNKVVPQTNIHEKHASTDKDAQLLHAVASKHAKDAYKDGTSHHQIVDKGEVINENVHHHVTNLITPVIVKDSHEHHRTQTVIPSHHEIHSAPIVHETISHKAIPKEEFLKTGGILGSKLKTAGDANLLHNGKCDRTVEGVGEKLEKELKLATGSHSTATATTGQAL
ncbi:unnamed protein product [Sympodiomycopsis kandeliae]